MIDRVVVFTGSKRDFEQYLENNLPEDEITIPFMELIQHYNARLRPNESGVGEAALQKNLYVDNCIVGADDYGSVMPHVLSNFVNIVTLNYQIGVLYVQNPPRRVLESLQSALDGDIEYKGSSYVELTRTVLKTIYQNLDNDVLGQDQCKSFLHDQFSFIIFFSGGFRRKNLRNVPHGLAGPQGGVGRLPDGSAPVLHHVQQDLHAAPAHVLHRLAESGQGGVDIVRDGQSVDGDNGAVLGDPPSGLPQGPHGPDGHVVGDGEQGGELRPRQQMLLHGQIRLPDVEGTGLDDQRRVQGQIVGR